MTLNYRVLAHPHRKKGVVFKVHLVSYKKGVPECYFDEEATIHADSIHLLEHELKVFMQTTKEPILWAGRRFPEVYQVSMKDTAKGCQHPVESLTEWHNDSILCMACDCVVSQEGENLEVVKPIVWRFC